MKYYKDRVLAKPNYSFAKRQKELAKKKKKEEKRQRKLEKRKINAEEEKDDLYLRKISSFSAEFPHCRALNKRCLLLKSETGVVSSMYACIARIIRQASPQCRPPAASSGLDTVHFFYRG